MGFSYGTIDDYSGQRTEATDADGNSVRAPGAITRFQSDCAAKRIVEDRAKSGLLTYLAILDEEVCEAAAQTDEDKLIAELVDVASVAMDWIETIQRRQAARANACREIIEANADA